MKQLLVGFHVLLLLAFAAATPVLRGEPMPLSMLLAEPLSDEAAYSAGMTALHEKRWLDAVHAFDEVAADHSSHRVDAALYWKAYALNRMRRATEASATCETLHAKFPASTWNRDCRSLSLVSGAESTASGSSGSGSAGLGSAEGTTDDLKILALNSLVHQDPARAMPILRGILTGNQSDEMKQQALFVLTQNHSPEAAALLGDAAAGKLGKPAQIHAINAIGVFKGHEQGEFLASLYRSSSDLEVKRAVISALFVAHDATRMVALARAEKDVELKRQLVSQLAIMNDKVATDYMLELLK